jgi:Na+-translocating ferredoxin:NAD+ oxidoreductase RnfD subunit
MESAAAPSPARRSFRIGWPKIFPPARCVWIGLAAIGGCGVEALAGLGLLSLLLLPLVAVAVDLALQSARFAKPRFPDAALATGLFLALILPPIVPLVLAGAVTFAAVGIRHALRARGRPFLNPAASGVVVGGLLFGLAPAWWVSVGPYGEVVMLGVGALLLVRNFRSWRIPVGFFVAYGLVVAAVHLLVSATVDSNVLLLAIVDPATLFFGLFMVTEPRTSPGEPALQPIYGAAVGVGAAVVPLALPSLGVLVALLLVNVSVAVLRGASTVWRAPHGDGRESRGRSPRRRTDRPLRWPVAYRVATGFFVLVVLIAAAGLAPNSHPIPLGAAPRGSSGGGTGTGGGGTGTPLADCSHDNPNIPPSTLSSLHQLLGPSVILSNDPNSGVVVFYDPVNHVTVTESDLYEDFGYAEFNGDDYAISGCHP